MGSRTSHKPADPNQHTTGQNHACSRSMKGCNIISGFFFYFLHSFIWNNCSRRQNIFLLCWKYCSRRLHNFLLYRNNYSKQNIFSLCWNNSLASKKISVLKIILTKKRGAKKPMQNICPQFIVCVKFKMI